MGSGCISNNNTGIFNSSFQTIPDTSVKYTGPAIPDLGICTGDTLSEVEAVILQQIVNFSQGQGVTLSDIDLTQCECFQEKVGCCGKEACQTLECILQAYLDCMCELYTDVQTLKTEVAAMYDGPYNTKCLSGVTSTSKLPAILQEVITELCTAEVNIASQQTQINNINSNLNTNIGNFILTALQSCNSSMVKSGTGASTTVTFKGFPPVGTIVPMAPVGLANFDSSGLGKTGTDACGWAIADGRNGTVNMVGLFPVGTTDMIGTPPISGKTLPNMTTGGEYNHLLTGVESGSAPHTHTVNDPGHSHIIAVNLDSASGANNSNYMKFDSTSFSNTLDGDLDAGNIHAKIRKNVTGITINSGGGSNASTTHNNTPPYRALYFIQRIA